MKEQAPGAGELAWLVLQIIAAGEYSRAHGWCLGPLRPVNLTVEEAQMGRSGSENRLERVRAKVRGRRHGRLGHDQWCAEFGISRDHLRRLIRELRPTDGDWLVLEAVEAAWGDRRMGAQSEHESARDGVEYRVRERITPIAYPDSS